MFRTVTEAFHKSIYGPLWRKYARNCRRFLRFPENVPSKLPVKVVIPLISKDLATINYCVRGLRENLLHPVEGFYLIGPAEKEIITRSKELECNFVDEREILPEGPEYYARYFPENRRHRSNWMYQQFLKLSVGQCLGFDNYLSVDADTVLINPFKYESDGMRIFDISDGYRSDLHSSMKDLLPRIIWKGFSFMCHVMLFQTSMVNRLLVDIERKTNRDWKTGVFESVDINEHVCFSEFELYANYSLQQEKHNYMLSYWFNNSLPFPPLESYPDLRRKYNNKFRTLSFHAYNSKRKNS